MYITEHRRFPHGLPDLLLYASLVEDGVMLLQDGALMAAWSFAGPDLASATHAEMESLTARLNGILRLGSGWMLHCDMIRSRTPEYPAEGHFPDPVTRLIDTERRAQFTQEGSHFESEYFLAITYLPPIQREEKIRGLMFEGGNDNQRPIGERALEFFRNRVDAFNEVFSSQFKARRLKATKTTDANGYTVDHDEMLRYIRRCVTGEDFPFRLPQIPVFLHDLIGCRDFEGGFEPKIGDKHMRVVAIDGFPPTSFPGMLAALDSLPMEYRWNIRAIMLDGQPAKVEIEKVCKKWKGKVRGFKDQLMGRHNGSIDADALAMVRDAEVAMGEASKGDVQFALFSCNVLILEDSEEKANDNAKQVIKTIQNLGGFAARIETVNAIEAWRGSLPGDGYRNERRIFLHTLNLADCLPIAAVWTGSQVNPSPYMPPDSPPLMYANAVGCTPFRVNLHVGDVGHTLVLGPSGAGKSTLLATLAAQWFRYPKAQVFCFDKGYAMYGLNRASGGEFYDIAGPGADLNFCPLAEIDAPVDSAWANEWVETLCMLTGMDITPPQRNLIAEAVAALKLSPERTMTELVANIQDQDIRAALQYYTLEGTLGRLLEANADMNALGSSRFMTFEMEHLMEFGDKAVVPILTYLFRQIDKRLDGSPTLIILDEAWVFLQHEMFKERIREWLKTFRKKNGAVILATQSLSDVLNSPIKDVILESCPTKILLPNAEARNDESRKLYEKVGLNEREMSILATAIPKRQYYMFSPVGRRLVNLGLGPVALSFVGVSDTDTRNAISALIKRRPHSWQQEWLRSRNLGRWADYYDRLLPLYENSGQATVPEEMGVLA
jgi:type IV secretion/conjugal transfer VirB4 family ATPase